MVGARDGRPVKQLCQVSEVASHPLEGAGHRATLAEPRGRQLGDDLQGNSGLLT